MCFFNRFADADNLWAKEIPYCHDNIKSFSEANAVAGLFWITVKGEGEGKGVERRLLNVLGRSRCSRRQLGGGGGICGFLLKGLKGYL